MYYTCVMYRHEKHRVRLYRKSISAVSSPDVFLCFHALLGWFHFLQKIHFCVAYGPEFPIILQVNYNHFGCFNVTKIPLHREHFPFSFVFHDVLVAVVVRRVEVGWEGGSANRGERHGRNPRLKLMCWYQFVLLHHFCFLSLRVSLSGWRWGLRTYFVFACLFLSYHASSCLV